MINHHNKHELKPCPFCGGTDLSVMQWIECNGCGAFGPTPGDDGDLSAWNVLRGVVVELPKTPNRGVGYGLFDAGKEACREAIESAGVTVKP